MNTAFIGLGHMGLPMALNLLKAGLALSCYDLAEAPLAQAQAAGARRAAGIADAVTGADVVITMLPASRHVEGAYLEADGGILAHAKAGALLIDCSTIAPASAIRVAQAAAERGLAMIDAPVSGGTAGAQASSLTFMVGGEAAALERARPWLEKMGSNIFHAGASGCGQTAKVCNNMLLGILMLGTSEALRLGIANGMDPAALSQIMSKSSGRNWALELYNPCPGVMPQAPASRGYQGGFGVDLMLKDLGLAVEAAHSHAAATPLGELARQQYQRLSEQGHGGLDFSCAFAYPEH
ncbi:3-hydroxyisobutyrate dehydrogenase [Paucibacter oligotrophus]|uniref:3-hydroxyisobutyrate dehydrogenase n=1 Tax=Roseateles oligotrophus TaxID=1769250 RepID=A0A840LHA2_9BURK|nr:3-hydroxyisobutyrate dehydrogenase [Roseateles oligotrophus]MBB4845992.1 3-hydroxyisobutyrate dehydrogenase [Roseateles oligotrophus]